MARDPAGHQPRLRSGRARAAARRAQEAERPDRRLDGRLLLTEGDRGAERPLYNVDHLLELWDGIQAAAPHAKLWLLGGPSERVRRRLAGRDDIVLFGRLPRDASALDCRELRRRAVYPRTADTGIQAAKVAEFIGLGVPTVSYDYAVTEILRETGAGVLVPTSDAFVAAVAGSSTTPRGAASSRPRPRGSRARLGRARAALRDRDPRPSTSLRAPPRPRLVGSKLRPRRSNHNRLVTSARSRAARGPDGDEGRDPQKPYRHRRRVATADRASG